MLARFAIYHSLLAVPDLWAVHHCVMFGDAALDAIRYPGVGISYRGCLEFVHRLSPRSGTRNRVRSCGCWCGWCGWP